MKLAIAGDLHCNMMHFAKIIEKINILKVDLLAFTGDFDTPSTMKMFTKIHCPVKAVLGNSDPDIQKFQYQLQNLPALKDLNLDISPRVQDFYLDKRRIAIFHGDDEQLTKMIIESQLYDVLCIGHDHLPKISIERKTTIINPGSLVGWMLERGEMPICYAIYNTETNKAEIIEI